MRLDGKVAIVIGAGSVGSGMGNGKACAILYAREGAKVMLVDNNLKAAEETKQIIIKENKGDCFTFQADIQLSQDCKLIMEKCIEKYGKIDILHNNVGINIRDDINACKEEDWIKILNINLTGMFFTCKYAIPFMEQNSRGSIINISSLRAVRAEKVPATAYAVSKAGVIALTREIAIQYAKKGIRANSILPGLIDTPRIYLKEQAAAYGTNIEERRKNRAKICPMGREGDAWDIAYASLFLASDEAKYITGTTLIVDGGLASAYGNFD